MTVFNLLCRFLIGLPNNFFLVHKCDLSIQCTVNLTVGWAEIVEQDTAGIYREHVQVGSESEATQWLQ